MCAPTATVTHHDQVLQVTCIVWADIIGEYKGAVQGIGGHVPDHQLGWTVHNGCRVHRVQPTHVQNPHAAKRIHCSPCAATHNHTATHTHIHTGTQPQSYIQRHTCTATQSYIHSHSHTATATATATHSHTHAGTRTQTHAHTHSHGHTGPAPPATTQVTCCLAWARDSMRRTL